MQRRAEGAMAEWGGQADEAALFRCGRFNCWPGADPKGGVTLNYRLVPDGAHTGKFDEALHPVDAFDRDPRHHRIGNTNRRREANIL